MNDGIQLDAVVCIPQGDAPDGGWPGVLLVHGHGDAGSKAATLERARRYAGRGYLAACYSVRGQGDSEGLSFHMGAREIFDIQDVIDWVLRETPVHPEKLAVAGSSQGGWHSYMAAAHHPQVVTVVPENIFTDYAQFTVRNGCLTRWFFIRTMRRRIMTAGLQELARQWALSGEWWRLQEWVRPTSPLLFADRIRCPVFILHGWHDMGMPPNEVVAMFQKLNVPKKLYLGGGGHDGQDTPEAEQFRQTLIDRWLDHWLKGEDTGILDEPPILYAQRPGWEHGGVGALPPEDVAAHTLYLHLDGVLSSDPPAEPTANSNVNNVPLDPNYTLQSAIYDDMAGVANGLARETVTFESEPLTAAPNASVEILGAPVVRLFMLSNQPHFQVHAELYDVAADGSARLITRGHYGTRAVQPGRHEIVEIECRTIAYRLAAGHRLRLVISNYDTNYVFPYFEPFCARLFHDNRHLSALQVPLRSQ
jgi:hypothetical protein